MRWRSHGGAAPILVGINRGIDTPKLEKLFEGGWIVASEVINGS